jgi:hypothetical protein
MLAALHQLDNRQQPVAERRAVGTKLAHRGEGYLLVDARREAASEQVGHHDMIAERDQLFGEAQLQRLHTHDRRDDDHGRQHAAAAVVDDDMGQALVTISLGKFTMFGHAASLSSPRFRGEGDHAKHGGGAILTVPKNPSTASGGPPPLQMQERAFSRRLQ